MSPAFMLYAVMRPYGGLTSGNPCGPSPQGPRPTPGPSRGTAPRPNWGVGKNPAGAAAAPPRPPPPAAGAPAGGWAPCEPPGPAGPALVGPACVAGPAARPPAPP